MSTIGWPPFSCSVRPLLSECLSVCRHCSAALTTNPHTHTTQTEVAYTVKLLLYSRSTTASNSLFCSPIYLSKSYVANPNEKVRPTAVVPRLTFRTLCSLSSRSFCFAFTRRMSAGRTDDRRTTTFSQLEGGRWLWNVVVPHCCAFYIKLDELYRKIPSCIALK